MTKLYRPSNGTEGAIFEAKWRENCDLFNIDDFENSCMINLRVAMYSIDEPEYPEEWQYSAGVPVCTAFTLYKSKPKPIPRCSGTKELF